MYISDYLLGPIKIIQILSMYKALKTHTFTNVLFWEKNVKINRPGSKLFFHAKCLRDSNIKRGYFLLPEVASLLKKCQPNLSGVSTLVLESVLGDLLFLVHYLSSDPFYFISDILLSLSLSKLVKHQNGQQEIWTLILADSVTIFMFKPHSKYSKFPSL